MLYPFPRRMRLLQEIDSGSSYSVTFGSLAAQELMLLLPIAAEQP
jgi:hypothetical protein